MPVQIKGRPEKLDTVLRPFVFAVLVGGGLIGTGILAWLGMWFWVPVPVVAGLLLHGLIFSIRGDRAITVTIEDGVLSAVDRKAEREHRLDLRTVRHAGLSVRRVDHSEIDIVYVVLHDEGEPLLALRLSTPRRAWPRHAVPLNALQPVLGGNAGVLRGLAPADRLIRQVLEDGEGELMSALLASIPEPAWQARPIRVWAGEAPPVDFMGLHQGPPDAVLLFREDDAGTPIVEIIDGRGPASVPAGVHPITATTGGRASRLLSLLALPGQEGRLASLPVLVWDVADGVQLAVPAPVAGHQGDEVTLTQASLHTHLGEGAGAIWWLLQRVDTVPDGLRQAIADARVALPTLHPSLTRHLPDEPATTASDSPDPALPAG